MRINAVRCRFGRLDGEYVFHPDRVTMIIDDNERGKTTLAEAITAALYGYPQNARIDDALRERERYLPLGGGPCFVELDVFAKNRRLRLRRDLQGQATDVVTVTDIDTFEDVTAEFAPSKGSQTSGERLTGLYRDEFLKICFVGPHSASDVRDGAGLTGRLQSMVDTSSGQQSAQSALAALQGAQRAYQGAPFVAKGILDNAIKRRQQDSDAEAAKQQDLRARRQALDKSAESLAAFDVQEGIDRSEIARLNILGDMAAAKALRQTLDAERGRSSSMRALQDEIEQLSPFRSAASDGSARLDAAWEALSEAEHAIEQAESERRAAEEDARHARTRLEQAGPLASWDSNTRGQLVAIRARLEDATRQHDEALSAWTNASRSAAPETRALYEGGSSPYATLSDAERTLLQAYRSNVAEARMKIAQFGSAATIGVASPSGGLFLRPLTIAGALVGILGIALLVVVPPAGVAAFLIAVGCLIAGLASRRSTATNETAIVARALAQRDLDATESGLAALRADAARLAERIGAVSAEAAADGLQRYLNAQMSATNLHACAEAKRGAETRLSAMQHELAAMLAGLGRPANPLQADLTAATVLLGEVDAVITARSTLDQRVEALRTTLARREQASSSCGRARARWSDLCRELGVDTEDHVAAGESAKMMTANKQRLLERESELRTLASQATREDGTGRELQLMVLDERIAAACAADPSLASLSPEQSASEYAHRIQAIQDERARRAIQRQEVYDLAGQGLEKYRREYPASVERKTEFDQHLKQLRRYSRALDLATRILGQVASESHQVWAEVLNREAGESLGRLAPAYATARFDQNLNLRVADVDGRFWSPPEIHRRLSTGVQDRIYLAVRLALAQVCSPNGDTLPLILDDPFITSDDERCAESMRFLLEEVSLEHQIILFTCHRRRHEDIRERFKYLWDDRVCVSSLDEQDATVA